MFYFIVNISSWPQDNSFSIWSTFHTSGSGPGIGNEEETTLGWERVRREKNLLNPKISTFFLSQHFLKTHETMSQISVGP